MDLLWCVFFQLIFEMFSDAYILIYELRVLFYGFKITQVISTVHIIHSLLLLLLVAEILLLNQIQLLTFNYCKIFHDIITPCFTYPFFYWWTVILHLGFHSYDSAAMRPLVHMWGRTPDCRTHASLTFLASLNCSPWVRDSSALMRGQVSPTIRLLMFLPIRWLSVKWNLILVLICISLNMSKAERFLIYLWTNQSSPPHPTYHLPTGLSVFFFGDLFSTLDLQRSKKLYILNRLIIFKMRQLYHFFKTIWFVVQISIMGGMIRKLWLCKTSEPEVWNILSLLTYIINKIIARYKDVLVLACHCYYICFYLQGEIPWLDKGSSCLENCKTSSPPRHHLLLPRYLFLLGYGPPGWMYFEKIIVTCYTFFKLTS